MAAAIPTKLISKEIVSSSHLVGVSYTEGGHDSPRSSSSQRNALDEFSMEFILSEKGREGKPLSVFAVSFPFEKFLVTRSLLARHQSRFDYKCRDATVASATAATDDDEKGIFCRSGL